jgi:NhaP-type Na+/H+ or K+/H+ antiporter
MTWLDAVTMVLLGILIGYTSAVIVAWIIAEKYERQWRAKLTDKEADREW